MIKKGAQKKQKKYPKPDESIYMEQLICSYIRHKRLVPAYRECMLIVPEGGFKTGMTGCMDKLVSTEGKYSVLEILSELDTGNMTMHLLHDVIAIMEERGVCREQVLLMFKEYIHRGDAFDIREKDQQRKHPRKRDKQKQDRQKQELGLCMLGLIMYTELIGFEEGLIRITGFAHGSLREEFGKLRAGFINGESDEELVKGFLPGTDDPEIRSCLIGCLRYDERENKGENIECILRPGVPDKIHVPVKHAALKGLVVLGAALTLGIWGHSMIKEDKSREDSLRAAMTTAMYETAGELDTTQGNNGMLAVFMQNMLLKVDDDIDLTVRICEMDQKDQVLEVEAVGEYDTIPFGHRRVTVRRRISF